MSPRMARIGKKNTYSFSLIGLVILFPTFPKPCTDPVGLIHVKVRFHGATILIDFRRQGGQGGCLLRHPHLLVSLWFLHDIIVEGNESAMKRKQADMVAGVSFPISPETSDILLPQYFRKGKIICDGRCTRRSPSFSFLPRSEGLEEFA